MASKFEVKRIDETTYELEIPSRSKTVTLKVSQEELEWLDKLTKELGFTNRSELLRRAVIEFLRANYLSKLNVK